MSDGIEYHWVLTLSGTIGPDHRQVQVGAHGLVVRDPSVTTRQDILNELIAGFQSDSLKKTGHLLDSTNVLFFQLEPNSLNDGSS